MKNYNDCNYSFFFSFSSADNDMRLDWITNCYDLLKKTTKGHISTIGDFKEPFYYVDEKILHGRLDAKIKRKLSESYAYIAVVDENYLKSSICDIEFDYIKDCIDRDETDVLAFVFVLSEDAAEILNNKYELSDYTVHHVYKSNGSLIPTTDQEIKELLQDIGKCISKHIENENKREKQPEYIEAGISLATDTASVSGTAGGISLAIGPCTDDITDKVADLIHQLEKTHPQGLDIRRLTEKDFSSISNPKKLGNFLSQFDLIIQPFSMLPPVYGLFQQGGLIASIQQSLEAVNQSDKLKTWYVDIDHDRAELNHGHIDFLRDLKTSALKLPEILQLLDHRLNPVVVPTAKDKAVIYIESSTLEKNHWQSLAAEIKKKWNSLNNRGGPEQPMYLVFRTMDFPNLMNDRHTTSRDKQQILSQADGVIVLWGYKDVQSLISHISFIEDQTLNTRTPEGIIAYLSPPQKDSKSRYASMGWDIVSFLNSSPEKIVEDEKGVRSVSSNYSASQDSETVLDHFLEGVRRKVVNKNNPAMGHAPG